MPTLVHFDFSFPGPWGAEMTVALNGFAQSIAAEAGLRWKIWTENQATAEAGGVYLFEDDASADAYITMHTGRLKAMGILEVHVKRFHVNEGLTKITRGPV